jgi:hypothetical protein
MSMPNTTIGKSHSCGDKRCKCCKHVQHSSSYTSKVTGKQCKIFCTVNCKSANVIYILECSFVAFNTLASLSSPSTNAWMDTGVTLQKKTFLHVSQHSRLSDNSLEDFNRMKILIIEQNCLWSDFQRENRERFWIKELRVLHLDGINRKQYNKLLCIFSFTVFIVNEYFTTITKLKIYAHHLLLTIILSILKCVTLYQVTIIPSYLYSQMRELKIFKDF